MSDLHLGVMSGTSMDGADAVLMDWSSRSVLGFASADFSPRLRSELIALCSSGPDEVERIGRAAIDLAKLYAAVVNDVLASANIRKEDVSSIGCHGQTIRHRPEAGFTVQIQNAALLAELTGIRVVADFRSRDIAAGGQGAPLAPAFHDDVFRDPHLPRAIINIGGISNLTRLEPGLPVSGFDCGPGNVLMDAWAFRHLGQPYDQDGRWASSGTPSHPLLETLLSEPYLSTPIPKSTGRELFNLSWLDQRLSDNTLPAADVQATLLEFTARCIQNDLRKHFPACREIYVCGGGARNPALMERLAMLTGLPVEATDALGIPSGQVEAIAFSWLARRATLGIPTSLEHTTGSRHPSILGAIYPA